MSNVATAMTSTASRSAPLPLPDYVTTPERRMLELLSPELREGNQRRALAQAKKLVQRATAYEVADRGLDARPTWRVKMTKGQASPRGAYGAGTVLNLPIAEAQSLIAAEAAQLLEPPELTTLADAWEGLALAMIAAGLDDVDAVLEAVRS